MLTAAACVASTEAGQCHVRQNHDSVFLAAVAVRTSEEYRSRIMSCGLKQYEANRMSVAASSQLYNDEGAPTNMLTEL
jgi:hypothetical protein